MKTIAKRESRLHRSARETLKALWNIKEFLLAQSFFFFTTFPIMDWCEAERGYRAYGGEMIWPFIPILYVIFNSMVEEDKED